jgi:hypothetical protein
MIDLKENNLPGNFRGELFSDLEQHKFQVPEPINVKEYIDSRIKEEVTMYQKDLTELPWGKVRWQPSCACFWCRLSRRVSGWFRGRK